MREGMLHIHDVEGPKKTESVEMRLEAMEQQAFKCQGMVERGLNANHMMITKFTNKHRIDANDIGKHLSRLYDRIDQLQAQIYDVQNQNSPPRKADRKVTATPTDLRAPEYARKSTTLNSDVPAKKASVKRPRKRTIHLVGRNTSLRMYADARGR
ncbi:40s ribosomal protein s5-1 [Hordeum vulgare]|nr:40s ribosomal protein s5-1 [Hordeum vulgare]